MRVLMRCAAWLGLAAGLCGCVYQAPVPYGYAPGAYPYAYAYNPYDPVRLQPL